VPGLIMLGMLFVSLPKVPMQLGLLRQGDWAGIIFMAIGLGALQTGLGEGKKHDWFGSDFIVRLSVIAAVALPIFVLIELTVKNPVINLRLLARRNFGLGSASTF